MKKLVLGLSVMLLLFLSGCGSKIQVEDTSPVDVETTAKPIVDQPSAQLPGNPTASTAPTFFEGYIARNQSESTTQTRFPGGTTQLFAFWNYKNMRDGLAVKREWYLDGQLWLEREEAWNFAKYGANGVMTDISIYDFDSGLSSGRYKLILYINGVAQPIGKKDNESQIQSYLDFEILSGNEATSPNGQWKATSLIERLVLTDVHGNKSDLLTAREIVSVVWLDPQRLVFVNRNQTENVSNNPFGIYDELWIVDILSRETSSLYKSETMLGWMGGLYVSPNGRIAAGIEGSGYGDACFLDARVIFFEMAGDYKSVRTIKQDQFTGISIPTDRSLYPTTVGTWNNDTQYSIYLNESCGTETPLSALYTFDIPNLNIISQSSEAIPPVAGDLGWGEIHGIVTDALSGNPIQGALVTCEHNSYTSGPAQKCAGGIETDSLGAYVYQRVFFHDTDTIKLTVTAPGYQPQEFIQNSFTINDLLVNFSLTPLP